MGLSVVGAGVLVLCREPGWLFQIKHHAIYFGAWFPRQRKDTEYAEMSSTTWMMRGCLVACCAALHQSQSQLLRAQSGCEYPLVPVHNSKSNHVEGKGVWVDFYFGQTHHVRPHEPVTAAIHHAYWKKRTTMAVNRRPVRPLECLSRVDGHNRTPRSYAGCAGQAAVRAWEPLPEHDHDGEGTLRSQHFLDHGCSGFYNFSRGVLSQGQQS